ncbi:DUF234 domain-containing protein [Malaciobacter mytili LMG 24559]|nr:DUF234 domain-containing protein [Malaciobacter mytili]AXH14838.1 DUF234 domain-containing protein [Malaciobacter mytili LMG 24559]
MNIAVKYFTIFGGLDIKIDTSKPLLELIETHILKKYEELKREIHTLTGGYSVDHALLSAIALGDRRTNSSFKRAHISFEEGMKCVENLLDRDIIEIESSSQFLLDRRNDKKIAKKLLFTTPFLRFWFAFVSPIYKGIKSKDYKEFYKRYENRKDGFEEFIFEELCLEFLDEVYKEDKLKNIGKYWDENITINLVAKTSNNKIIAANCKYTNSKLKKKDLNKLIEDCKDIKLDAQIFILFSKSGFVNELKMLKNENLRLFTEKSLKALIK